MGSSASTGDETTTDTTETLTTPEPPRRRPQPRRVPRDVVNGGAATSSPDAPSYVVRWMIDRGDGDDWKAAPEPWIAPLEAAFAVVEQQLKGANSVPTDKAVVSGGAGKEGGQEGDDGNGAHPSTVVRLVLRQKLYYADVKRMLLRVPGGKYRPMRRTVEFRGMATSADPFATDQRARRMSLEEGGTKSSVESAVPSRVGPTGSAGNRTATDGGYRQGTAGDAPTSNPVWSGPSVTDPPPRSSFSDEPPSIPKAPPPRGSAVRVPPPSEPPASRDPSPKVTASQHPVDAPVSNDPLGGSNVPGLIGERRGSNDDGFATERFSTIQLRFKRQHDVPINAISMPQGGGAVALGGRDGSLATLTTDRWTLVKRYESAESSVLRVAHSTGGLHFAVGLSDGTVVLYPGVSSSGDSPDAPCAPEHIWLEHDDKCYGVGFTADGRSVVSVSMDHTLKRYDVNTLALLADKAVHGAAIYCLTLSLRSPNIAVTGGDDGTCAIVDLRTPPTVVERLVVPAAAGTAWQRATVWSVGLRYDDAEVATGSMDGNVCLWDLRGGSGGGGGGGGGGIEPLITMRPHGNVGIHSVKYLDDGSTLLTSGRDGYFRLSKVGGAGAYEASFLSCHAHNSAVYDVEYANGTAVSIGSDRFIKVWDLS